MRLALALFLFAASQAGGATWYASPSATAGAGSIGDPFALRVALTNAAVQSGDTLYLRAGTYTEFGFYCTLSGVTIRSYPGERVILSDGPTGVLVGAISGGSGALTTNVIKFSETWRAGLSVSIGWEVFLLSETRGSPTNWYMLRGTPTNSAHSDGDAVLPYNNKVLAQVGTNCTFRDFEITSPWTTNRVFTYAFNPSTGLDLHGKGNKAISLLIYNTGHPGIGFWNQGAGGEINGCQFWGIGHYDYTGGFNGDPRGTAIYSQNGGGIGMAQIKNCIFHHVLTDGAEVFGETGPVQDFIFDGDISMANGTAIALEIASGSTATSNTWMRSSLLMGQPVLSYVSLSNSAEYFYDNIVVSSGFGLKETTGATITNNDVLLLKGAGVGASAVQYSSTVFSSNVLSLTWDYQRYYIGDGASPYQWLFTSSEGTPHNNAGGDTLIFDGDNGHSWKAWTGLDTHSTCVTNWPTDYLRVQSFALDYDANRHFVGVVNTTAATSVPLDLSTNGFKAGDIYTLRDAQNYFTVIAQGVYSGAALTLPLNLTNIATLQGSVTNFVPQHTNVQQPGLFNAFVLDRTDGGGSIAQLNVGTLIIR